MKEFIKKNFALLLAFILPLVLIIIVALSVYFPSRNVSTHYNFLYSSCFNSAGYYSYDNCNGYMQKYYSVVNNRLTVNQLDTTIDLNKDGVPDFNKNSIRIFLHDTLKNESREISIEEAQGLTLSSLLTSPDGVTVSSNYNRGVDIFPFVGGYSSSYGFYLTKGKGKSKLNLINNNDQYYYQNNFQFIGWVSPGRN